MKNILAFVLLVFSTIVAAEEAIDIWPHDIVPTARDYGIKGFPKVVKLSVKSTDGRNATEMYEFYKGGILKKSSTTSGAIDISVRLDRRGKVKEVVHGSLEPGNARNAETYRPFKYDEDGRVVIITSESEELDGIVRKFAGTGIRRISYNDNVRTYDQYYKHGEAVGPLNRERVEVEERGTLVARCWGGEIGKACDRSQPIKEYGRDGITRYLTGSSETIYSYENGLLASEIRKEFSQPDSLNTIRYMSYALDSCGNWISREQIQESEAGAKSAIEIREINYYLECK